MSRSLLLLLIFCTYHTVLAKPIEYKIYLAGPEVFMPDPIARGDWKKAIIQEINKTLLAKASFRFKGLYPMDNEIADFAHDPKTAMNIFKANLDLMDEAHLVIANMTHFRGPSMDVGTAFEMGYMNALKKPVLGYFNIQETYCTKDHLDPLMKSEYPCGSPSSDVTTNYFTKVLNYNGETFGLWTDHEGVLRDRFANSVEQFGLSDNLMMIGAVRYHNGEEMGYEMADSFRSALLEAVHYFSAQKRQGE